MSKIRIKYEVTKAIMNCSNSFSDNCPHANGILKALEDYDVTDTFGKKVKDYRVSVTPSEVFVIFPFGNPLAFGTLPRRTEKWIDQWDEHCYGGYTPKPGTFFVTLEW